MLPVTEKYFSVKLYMFLTSGCSEYEVEDLNISVTMAQYCN